MIEQVRSKGHEISSHGYFHANAKNMTMENFEADLLKSLEVLRKVSGEKVLGFRTPYFSITKLQPI